MDSEPLIKVLVPVRDAAATLAKSLESLRAQSFRRWECLVLDDGSRDDSREIAQAFAALDPRFIPVSLPARGIVPTLNEGFRLARAPLIARHDADDEASPRRFEAQWELLSKNPQISFASCRVAFLPEGVSREGMEAYEEWLNSLITPDEIARDIYIESPLPHPTWLVRRESLERLCEPSSATSGPYRDGPWPEDYDLLLRAHTAGMLFAKVPEVLQVLRNHPRRLTRTCERYKTRRFLNLKLHHLVETQHLRGKEVILWGAGKNGRRIGRILRMMGVGLRAFIDIRPEKIGTTRLGVPIYGPAWLHRHPKYLLLICTGARGARQEIREFLTLRGYAELEDFICIA